MPRSDIAQVPTPLEPAPHLSAALGDVNIFFKRDDLTGRAFGGNKTRELDFIIGEAVMQGADVFISGGGARQSNHAVQCSAAAIRAGLIPVVVIYDAGPIGWQGNLLLDDLMGVDIRFLSADSIDNVIFQRDTAEATMVEVAAEYVQRGHRPYILPSSFHPLAAAAYAGCMLELNDQTTQIGLSDYHVYVTSSGATQTGLILGSTYMTLGVPITGISHTAARDGLENRLVDLADRTADLLNIPRSVSALDIENESFAGPGYGILTDAAKEAIRLTASTEGIFLDPVYTGKGMAGLIAHIREGRLASGSNVIFVHTGGLPAIFSYSAELMDR